MTREDERLEQAKNYNSKGFENAHTAFLRGAEWADSTMIDNACEWLERALPLRPDDRDEFIEQFKQAMEGDEV